MILPLRQRHRRILAVLGVLLPIAFVVGIAARKPAPMVATLPKELAATSPLTSLVWERGDLFIKAAIRVQLLRQGTGKFALSFSAPKDFARPDLLVYWVAGRPTVGDTLPSDATLLGAFSAGALALPDEAANAPGSLILFSLADQEIVDASKPFLGAPASLPASSTKLQTNPPTRMPAPQ